MFIEITKTTLRRLINYEAVIQKEYDETAKLQWRVMTLEVMRAAEAAQVRARQVSVAVAYARYLYRLQCGKDSSRYIYGEPMLSKALTTILDDLLIESKLISE